MSTSVNIYVKAPPTFEHRQLRLDDATTATLPPGSADAAEWCEATSRLLAAEAVRLRGQAEQERLDLEAARQMVAGLRGDDA